MNYEEAKNYLYNIPRFSKKTTMENTRNILKKLGNPEKNIKIFHVAGSNGKGSVCAYLNAILMKTGMKVGLFTSPHLIKPNERIKINGNDISDEVFLTAFDEVSKVIGENEELVHPSFFEFIFLMAMTVFRNEKVQYAVLEVGLGGRLDATNAVTNKLISVITSLSLEHTEILGEKIEEIAKEKSGIIKKGVPVIIDGTNEEALKQVLEEAKKLESEAIVLRENNIKILKKSDKNIDFSLNSSYHNNEKIRVPFVAPYQCMNASLAAVCIETAKKYDKTLEILDFEKIYDAILNVKWEGRMECINNNIYVDGAHNVSGIDKFIEAAKGVSNKGKKYLLFSVVKEKDYKNMIAKLSTEIEWEHIYVTEVDTQRAAQAGKISHTFKECGMENVSGYKGVSDAMEEALGKINNEDVLFCAGSLYLVGEVKGYLERKKYD